MQDTSSGPNDSRPALFIFRGNAAAAGGYLTQLDGKPIEPDPQVVTVNGESSLPVTGGVSHMLVQEPILAFKNFIEYGPCETFAEGRVEGDTMMTTVRASVDNVRVTTRPSPEDHVPGISSISFTAGRLAITVKSNHPQRGSARFELLEKQLETDRMALVLAPVDGKPEVVPIRLDFDYDVISHATEAELNRAFMKNRGFFDDQVTRFHAKERLVFSRSAIPRKHGYIFTSIVKRIYLGDKVIPGNVLVEPGFGTLYFGTMLVNEDNRRTSLVRIEMGSDPKGHMNFAGVDPNGIWR